MNVEANDSTYPEYVRLYADERVVTLFPACRYLTLRRVRKSSGLTWAIDV